MTAHTARRILVVDIGGTNCRFAAFTLEDGRLALLHCFLADERLFGCESHADLELLRGGA
ncbi:MAG: hypothetical protein LBN28_00665 [Desulfovibrio sp.]|jgi:glucokinase|nr:hypothetical protein [Desulfovibrio sp.]